MFKNEKNTESDYLHSRPKNWSQLHKKLDKYLDNDEEDLRYNQFRVSIFELDVSLPDEESRNK